MVYDLKYGSAYSERHGQEVDLLLDVYRPTVALGWKAPAVLLIHGGNFIGGSKQAGIMEAEALYFARAGFVVFNMNYRLEGSTYLVELSAVRDAVHDAKAAVRFIVDQAESFRLDPTRIAAWGESAGGITAISMNSVSSEGSSGNPGLSSNISAAVSLSGTMWPFLVASPRNEVLRDTPWFNVHSKADSVVYPFLAAPWHTWNQDFVFLTVLMPKHYFFLVESMHLSQVVLIFFLGTCTNIRRFGMIWIYRFGIAVAS